MSFTSLLSDRVRLQTPYSSQNEMLDWTYTYSSASSETKCRLTPVSAYERIDPTGKFDDVRYFGYFKSGTAIDKGDRIIHGSETLLVREKVIDSQGHHLEILLSEIKV